MARVFDRTKAHDVYETITILYGVLALALCIIIGCAMYYAEWRTFYWSASIASTFFIIAMAALSFYLFRNALMVDGVSTPGFLKMMRCHDVLAVITGLVCLVGLGIAGWLGLKYGTAEVTIRPIWSDAYQEALEDRDRNGKIAWGIAGLNFMGDMVMVMCLWANYKFRQFIRSQENLMNPESRAMNTV